MSRSNVLTVPNFSSNNQSSSVGFIKEEGCLFAGKHLLIDCWGSSALDDKDLMHQAFLDSVKACGATLLHIHLHVFSDTGGLSGVAVLAESHISVHTWPEHRYAAFDVFMCGEAKPENSIAIIESAFTPDRLAFKIEKRGQVL